MPTPYARTAPVAQLLNELQLLQRQDHNIEQEMATCKARAWLWAIGLFAAIGFFFLSKVTDTPFLVILAVLSFVGSLPFVIYWGVKYSGWASQNMEDRRLEIPVRFFEVLGSDVPKKRLCAVQIDFDGYQKHGQLLENTTGGLFSNVRQKKYVDTWFKAGGSLVDGNKFRLSIEQDVSRKEKSKRKYTKVSERLSEEVTLLLRLSPTSYPHWDLLPQYLVPASLPNLQVTRVNIQNGTVRLVAETPVARTVKGRYGTQTDGVDALVTGDTLLQLFVYVYAQLEKCRGSNSVNA